MLSSNELSEFLCCVNVSP